MFDVVKANMKDTRHKLKTREREPLHTVTQFKRFRPHHICNSSARPLYETRSPSGSRAGREVRMVSQLRGRRRFCPVQNIVLARKHSTATASHCSAKWRSRVVVVHGVTASQKQSPLVVDVSEMIPRPHSLFPFARARCSKFAT